MNKSLSKRAGSALVWKAADSAAVKLIFLVRLVVLARLLSPDDFGLLAIAVSALGLLLALSEFGMIPALVQRSTVSESDLNVAWTIGVLRAIAVVLVVSVSAPWIATIFDDIRATEIIRVLALGVLIDALASIRIAVLTRQLDFRALAALRLTKAIVNTVVAIALAPSIGVWALVAGALSGSLASTAISYAVAPHLPRLRWHWSAAASLLAFGRWVFVTGVVVVGANAVLRAIVARTVGVAELGVFFMADRLAYLAVEAMEGVAGSVAFPLYARLQDRIEKARTALRAALVATSAVLIPAGLLLAAIAPGLTEYVLGDRWAGAAPVIQVLAIANAMGIFTTASLPLLNGFGMPSGTAMVRAVESGLAIFLVWILADGYGLLGVAYALLIAVVAAQVVSALLLKRVIQHPFEGMTKVVGTFLFCSLVGVAVVSWLDRLVGGFIGFVLAAASGLFVTATLIYLADRRLGLGLGRALARPFPEVARFFRLGDF